MEPRVFVSRRAVHGTDVGRDGRLRLDALARYLQAAAEGDLAGAGYRSTYDWVVRRCAVRVHTYPRLGQRLQVRRGRGRGRRARLAPGRRRGRVPPPRAARRRAPAALVARAARGLGLAAERRPAARVSEDVSALTAR
jgi:hypothetical protein